MKYIITGKWLALMCAILSVVIIILIIVIAKKKPESNNPNLGSSGIIEPPIIYTQDEIDEAEGELGLAHLGYLREKVTAYSVSGRHLRLMANYLEGHISEVEYEKSKSVFNKVKIDFRAAKNRANAAYVKLKKINPSSPKLAELEDEANLKSGDSPYSELFNDNDSQ